MLKTHQEYMDALVEGDSKGLREIYDRFLPRITRLITSNGGSRDDANDIFQDALIILYEKARSKDFKLTSGFYTLLYGVCRNLWGNRLQKSSFKEVTIPENLKYSSEDNLEATLIKEEENRLFRRAFQQLGEDCRQLLGLFFEKRKMAEIQEIMGFSSVNYTKKRKFHCKEKLVELIKADPTFDEFTN